MEIAAGDIPYNPTNLAVVRFDKSNQEQNKKWRSIIFQ
jgi:hypothetical protein